MIYSDKLCFGCKQVLPVEEFYRRSEPPHYLYSKCKSCHNRRVNGSYKRLSIAKYIPFLEEIIFRCGSQRKAAKRLGVAKSQLRLWIGASRRVDTGKKQRTIARESARKIVVTLRELRQADVHYIHQHQPGPKPRWLRVDDTEAERGRKRRAA